jgi:hypothetical protein
MIETTELKVGDTVEVTFELCQYYGNTFLIDGSNVKVKTVPGAVPRRDTLDILVALKDGHTHFASCFKLVKRNGIGLGDKVKVLSGSRSYKGNPSKIGSVATVVELGCLPSKDMIRIGLGDGYEWIIEADLVERLDGSAVGPETTHQPNKETVLMSAIDDIKNSKLTQTDRVLHREGLEDSSGTVSQFGTSFMNQKMWEENREAYAKEIIAAKKLLANEQAAYAKMVTADAAEDTE